MARYYFDIHDGAYRIHDDEGAEFDSLDGAMQVAARAVTEIGTSRLTKGDTCDVVIEVRDEQNRQVGTVAASMAIKRSVSRPQGAHYGARDFA